MGWSIPSAHRVALLTNRADLSFVVHRAFRSRAQASIARSFRAILSLRVPPTGASARGEPSSLSPNLPHVLSVFTAPFLDIVQQVGFCPRFRCRPAPERRALRASTIPRALLARPLRAFQHTCFARSILRTFFRALSFARLSFARLLRVLLFRALPCAHFLSRAFFREPCVSARFFARSFSRAFFRALFRALCFRALSLARSFFAFAPASSVGALLCRVAACAQEPDNLGIEQMSLFRVQPSTGAQTLLNAVASPAWRPVALIPEQDGSVLVALAGLGAIL
eukprot:6213276-Pleurochrysis_carterae.AAC.1